MKKIDLKKAGKLYWDNMAFHGIPNSFIIHHITNLLSIRAKVFHELSHIKKVNLKEYEGN